MTAPISNPGRGAFGGQPGFSFNAIDRTMIASYGDYAGAQRAIDYLSDKGFPVEHTAIVGSDLRLVEQVTGRLTLGRASLAGAGAFVLSGLTQSWHIPFPLAPLLAAGFGLFFGLLLGIFTNRSFAGWFALVLTAVIVGAIWGALFGLVAHSLTGGRRDFASRSGLVAAKYDVMVESAYSTQAREILETLT